MQELSTLFDKDKALNPGLVEDTLKVYYNSTDISAFSIDEFGNTVLSCGDAEKFCFFFKELIKDEACPCTQAHLYASKQALLLGEAYIFFCPLGLVHYTAPLIKDKQFRGALIAGPILMEYPDDMLVDEIIKKYELTLNHRGRIASHLKAIPVVEPSRVKYLSRLLFIMASNLMAEDKYILYERNKKLSQQRHINESIQELKSEEASSNYYPYEKEKELMVKVRNGDVMGAKTILNEVLGYIFFASGGNIEIIKARTLELCTLLSRAAVEGGAGFDTIFGLNFRFIGELGSITNIEDLSYWILKVLDRFTENVFNLSNSKNAEIIKNALGYINENYAKEITLDLVANSVHLNSSYFSTIFKKETGMRFSDYLSKVRIEESKKLLKDIRLSILDVALMVGFEDQSYYTKVFKRITGMTPKEFKDNQGYK